MFTSSDKQTANNRFDRQSLNWLYFQIKKTLTLDWARKEQSLLLLLVLIGLISHQTASKGLLIFQLGIILVDPWYLNDFLRKQWKGSCFCMCLSTTVKLLHLFHRYSALHETKDTSTALCLMISWEKATITWVVQKQRKVINKALP